jgi:hypothetical protein
MYSTQLFDALTMTVLNLCAALILTALHVVNAAYHWPNPFVTVAAPLAASVFVVLTALWLLVLTRRARRRPSASNACSGARRATPVPAPVLVHSTYRAAAR